MRDLSQNLFHFSILTVWSLLIFFPLHSQPLSSPLTFRVVEISPASCYGVSDGVAEILVEAPEKVANISWDFTPKKNTLTVRDLAPGKHWINLTDREGRVYRDSIVINSRYAIRAEAAVISDESHEGAQDGVAKIQVLEAEGSVSFHWDGFPKVKTGVLSNLDAGMYTVTVRDDRGCEATHAVSIIQQDEAGEEFMNIDWAETALDEVELFPNPSSGKFQIVLPDNTQELNSIKIFDLAGKEVYAGISIQNSVTTLDFSHMSTGMYSIVLDYGNKQVTKKLLLN